MTLTGQVGSNASSWAVIERVGRELGTCFYYLDYNRLSGEYGTMQLAPFVFTGNEVGSVVSFNSQGSILDSKVHYPVNLVDYPDPQNPGQVIIDAAGITAQNAARRLYGFKDLTLQ